MGVYHCREYTIGYSVFLVCPHIPNAVFCTAYSNIGNIKADFSFLIVGVVFVREIDAVTVENPKEKRYAYRFANLGPLQQLLIDKVLKKRY